MARLSVVGSGCLVAMLFTLVAVAGRAEDIDKCITKKCKSGVEVALTFEADRLVAVEPFEVELKVLDAKGNPASDALIYCSMFMPNFATGSNRPKLEPLGKEGKYRGIVFFERAGLWHANLAINLSDGTYEDVTLEIGEVQPAGS